MVEGDVTCSEASLAMTMAPVEYAEVMVTVVSEVRGGKKKKEKKKKKKSDSRLN